MMHRRQFFHKTTALSGAAFCHLSFLSQLPRVTAAEAQLPKGIVQLHPEIEPLVRFLEETSSEKILEEVALKIRKGLSYRELLAALLLAGVRNIQPRPVGFKFHAVLVLNSAHLASLAAPDEDRWLPLFWAINEFKKSQAADVKEGNWTMSPVDESAVPPSHKARKALVDALNQWDEPAADAAIVGMVRSCGSQEIFETLCRFGVRDFREIGHKQIYLANSFRTLETIGWHHAEPVMRSLVYAMLDRVNDPDNPAKSDYSADRPFRKNLERLEKIKPGWIDGKLNSMATEEMLQTIRQGDPDDAGEKVVELLNKGVSPQSLFDAFLCGAGELMMRAPGILSLHASTFSNATRYGWARIEDDPTRRLMLLQNASFLPLFRGTVRDSGLRVDNLEPASNKSVTVEDIFGPLASDRPAAAKKVLGYLKSGGDPVSLAQAARRLIFMKGRDAHDYKYSSAILEDWTSMSAEWRDRFLATSVFYLKGNDDPDNGLVKRIRAALG